MTRSWAANAPVDQLLTGRLRAKDRQSVLDGLSSGSVDIVVGTHALLTDDVRFRALGVIVIDEQHRFGVEQRAALRDKDANAPTKRPTRTYW